jgi:LDH2 family malate/lactate/ureidoglycolate dehydrogenase
VLSVTIDEATRLCQDALRAVGASPEQTATIADCIMYASRRGVDTHGIVGILPATLAGIRAGRIDLAASPEIVQQGPAVVRIDAHHAPGPVAGAFAMDEAIARARRYGLGAAAVFNGNHFGAASYYADRALRQQMIGLAMCNAAPRVAPHLGREPFLGTNPIAYAAPGGSWPAISLDVATTVAAAGKVGKAQRRGEPIPAGWVIDGDGQPITDAARAAGSTFLHMGEHKGYGLAMLVELLTGALGGDRAGLTMPRTGGDGDRQYRSFFFLALDVDQMLPLAQFQATVDQLANDAHSIAPAPGAPEVLAPGEPELRETAARQAGGIPFHEGDWAALLRGLARAGFDEAWVDERAHPSVVAR